MDDNSFGDEAINTLVQEMEDHKDDVIVILAGYSDRMRQFINSNPGLRSRIAFNVQFDDYSTDNHFDGIKGAEATAVQIFLAGQGYDMRELAEYQEEHYYKIEYNVKWLIDNYTWCSLCDGTCQAAFQCLYESTDFEDAIRNCMAIGGDCDTTGAICGGIAEAVYGVPDNLRQEIRSFLDDSQLSVIDEFCERFV